MNVCFNGNWSEIGLEGVRLPIVLDGERQQGAGELNQEKIAVAVQTVLTDGTLQGLQEPAH